MSNSATFFSDSNIVLGQAPGRLDVMGGIADYSGSLVLQMPISKSVIVRAAYRSDDILRVYSLNMDKTVELPLSKLPTSYAQAEAFFSDKSINWAAYILGCLIVLKVEKPEYFKHRQKGIDFWVESSIPIGKGVSSSAALEIATMSALEQLKDIEFNGTEKAVLAQKAENLVVGAPCGLMDQLACSHGKEKYLLPILCQPDIIEPIIQLPEEVHFVGIDSGVRHAVNGASYGDVRTAAFMGYSIIAMANGCNKEDLKKVRGSQIKEHLPYKGYLCNIPPARFHNKYKALLPDNLSGAEFLSRYGLSIDPITYIEEDTVYQVKDCTRHPVEEHHRVSQFRSLIETALHSNDKLGKSSLSQLGEWMYQSHESYTDCGLGNDKTDELVQLVRSAGPSKGLYGAKITGGGSGGTVCVLCYGSKGLASAYQLTEQYQQTNPKTSGIIF